MTVPHDVCIRMLTRIAETVGIEPPDPGESTLFFERCVVETVVENAKTAALYRELQGPLRLAVLGGR